MSVCVSLTSPGLDVGSYAPAAVSACWPPFARALPARLVLPLSTSHQRRRAEKTYRSFPPRASP